MTSRRNESVNALNLEKTLKDDFKSEGLLVDLYFHFKHVFQEDLLCKFFECFNQEYSKWWWLGGELPLQMSS